MSLTEIRPLPAAGCRKKRPEGRAANRHSFGIGNQRALKRRRVICPLIAQFRSARIAAGLTLRDVARRSGYNISTLSDWECGAAWPTVPRFMDVCEVVGLKLTLSAIVENTA
jgi:hypothetical protein